MAEGRSPTTQSSGPDSADPSSLSTAMLLFGANDLVISDNTITGAGTDNGIAVDGLSSDGIPSTNMRIENNHIERTSALPVAPTRPARAYSSTAPPLPNTTLVATRSRLEHEPRSGGRPSRRASPPTPTCPMDGSVRRTRRRSRRRPSRPGRSRGQSPPARCHLD